MTTDEFMTLMRKQVDSIDLIRKYIATAADVLPRLGIVTLTPKRGEKIDGEFVMHGHPHPEIRTSFSSDDGKLSDNLLSNYVIAAPHYEVKIPFKAVPSNSLLVIPMKGILDRMSDVYQQLQIARRERTMHRHTLLVYLDIINKAKDAVRECETLPEFMKPEISFTLKYEVTSKND